MTFDFNIFAGQPLLPTIWFVAIGIFWIGYLILDSFDLGVGMLMSIFAKNEKERRLLLNTIGPVWDGNEVWLVTGGAATFAAFPLWYASLFSALYIPLTLALLALIFRVVAIEYRGKKNDERWIRGWTIALSLSSFFIALLVGALLALTSIGLPINANGDRVGGAFAWASWPVLLGGLSLVGFALVQGLAFVALKTDGDIRHRARTIVLTHFPPHPVCIAPPYADSPLNPYFINQIDVAGFEHWIAGHTHHAVDTIQDDCRIIINPLGYPNSYGQNGYRDGFLLELPD